MGISARGSFSRWLNTAKKEEIGYTNRQYQIESLNWAAKVKDKILLQKDRAITSLVRKHKNYEITTANLVKHYMLTNKQLLSRNMRHFTSFLNQQRKKVKSTLQCIFAHILKQKKSLFQRFLFHKQNMIMYVLWPYLNIKIPVFEKTCTKAFFF